MRKLVLIKHSMPILTSSVPANQWTLSEEGIKNTEILAKKLRKYNFDKIYCSEEPKAIETAEIIAREYSKIVEVIEGLHEHKREKNKTIYSEQRWKELIVQFFNDQDNIVLGEESANAARERFASTINRLIESRSDAQDLVVVSHGRVMSLFISKYNEIDPFELWSNLGLPSYVELSVDDFRIIDIVNI